MIKRPQCDISFASGRPPVSSADHQFCAGISNLEISEMKMLLAGVAFATLVASPAFAQSYDPDIGTGNIAGFSNSTAYASTSPRNLRLMASRSAYGSFAAVTPFDAPTVVPNARKARAAAIGKCTAQAARYSEYTWGDMEFQQYRACMAANGQAE